MSFFFFFWMRDQSRMFKQVEPIETSDYREQIFAK